MSETRTQAVSDEVSERRLARVRTLGRVLDEAFVIPGTNRRVGLDPILGILPGAGDAVGSLLSLYIIFEAYRSGAPPGLLAKMLGYVAVDTVVGSIPLVGPVFDTFWTANTWNVRLLITYLERRRSGDTEATLR